MTKEQAIALAESKFWETLTPRQIAEFQMAEPLLCMPFGVFQDAVEKTLGRSVFTHEFGLNYQGIKDELLNGKEPPTLAQILDLIPAEKLALVIVG